MKDTALEKMTVKELIDMQRRVEAMIVVKQDRERIEVREKIHAMAKEHGFEVSELFTGRGKGGRGKAAAPVKYRNPEDHTQTWSGRGRKPNWINEAGGDAERFRLK
jgi:DNA-binding protein H-NS